MTKKTEKEVLITLDFSSTEKKFTNIDELREFMQHEKSAWSWLEQPAREDGNLARVWNPFGNYFKRVDQFIASYTPYQGLHDIQTESNSDLKNQTQTAVDHGFILAETSLARFIFDLKNNKSPQIAGYALASLSGIKIETNHLDASIGKHQAMKYLQGLETDSADVQQKKLEAKNMLMTRKITALQKRSLLLVKKAEEQVTMQATIFENRITRQETAFESQATEQAKVFENRTAKQESDFELILNGAKKRLTGFENQKATQENVFERRIDKQASDSEKQIAKQAEDFEITLNEAKGKLTDFETTFKEDIALQSSVAYWTKKRKHHQKVMWWMAASTAIFAIATGLIFIWAANVYLDVTIDEVKLSQIGVLLAISTLGVWLTRLSAKIFISNLHLRTDADERVTMIQTYLALLAEGNGPKDGERQLILQTLFRSSSTGFIKDDGPTTPFETLATKVTSKKE